MNDTNAAEMTNMFLNSTLSDIMKTALDNTGDVFGLETGKADKIFEA